MKEIKVVAALIENNDKYLLAKRCTGDENVFGKWEFPGGKVEKDETEEQALERELLEEFEMTTKAECFITNNVCVYPSKVIDLRLYKCKYVNGEFHLHDHSEYEWVSLKEILNYDLCKADIPLAKYLIDKYKYLSN